MTTVFETIRRLAKEHDPLGEGIEVEITPQALAYPQKKRPITAEPRDRPLDELISLMTCLTNLACRVTGKGVQIRSTFEEQRIRASRARWSRSTYRPYKPPSPTVL